MKDMGHRACIESALNFEKPERTPFCNFADIAMMGSAGIDIAEARQNAKVSTKCAIRYAQMTGSDLVFPLIDTNIQFKDIVKPMKVELTHPADNYTLIRNKIAQTPEQVDALELYDPFDSRSCPEFTSAFVDNISDLANSIEEDWHVFGFCWAPLSTAGFLMGTEEMMMNILLEPDLVHRLFDKTAVFCRDIQKRCIDAGATVMWMADPTAGEDLIDANTFREFEKPCLAEVVRGASEYNKDTLMFLHMCGFTENSMMELPDIGVQVFSCDVKNDLGRCRKALGKSMSLMGNVSPVGNLLMGGPEDVREESYDCIRKAGMDGGFILAPGCEVPRDAPDANVIAMGDAARSFWKSQ